MKSFEPIELSNEHVRLVPTSLPDATAFFEIGKEASIWKYLAPEPFQTAVDAQKWIETMLARPEYAVTYTVFDLPTGEVAGSTSFLNVSERNDSLEIGFTWYGKRYQRTYVNTAAKLAMLQHAFEELGAGRVQLQTDARNKASQRAIARIGGVQEGVLRNHKKYPNGFARDTVVFSIINDEWPALRGKLNGMLASGT